MCMLSAAPVWEVCGGGRPEETAPGLVQLEDGGLTLLDLISRGMVPYCSEAFRLSTHIPRSTVLYVTRILYLRMELFTSHAELVHL